jgi:hypothetical protein
MRPARFDLLDHLHTIDADTRWINREDLATTLGTSTDAAHARMMKLERDGLLEIRRHERVVANACPPPDYRLTGHGTALYRAELARIDGNTGPPQVTPDLQRAFEVTTLLHALGKDAA